MSLRVYLAGPEVFLPDAEAIGEAKKALCRHYGLTGLFPLDADLDATDPASIFRACVAMVRAADAVIANLTPFRGASADVGTVFELGLAVGLGLPVFGYTSVPGSYRARVEDDGLLVEDFGHADNLMVAEAVIASGARIVQPGRPVSDLWRDLAAFETCLQSAVAVLAGRSAVRSTVP